MSKYHPEACTLNFQSAASLTGFGENLNCIIGLVKHMESSKSPNVTREVRDA